MPNPEPIKQYMAAVEFLKSGDKDKAAEYLALALGGQESSPIIRDSVEKMLTPDTYINDLIMECVASTVTRKDDHGNQYTSYRWHLL